MRHQKKTKKLNRPKGHRESILANLATSLFAHRTLETTDARAKELRRVVDRLIRIAKTDTLAARRQVARVIHDKAVHKKLFTEIVPALQDRNSGYTRVMKKGIRRGDASVISVVELLTPRPVKEEPTDKKGRKKAKAKSETAESSAGEQAAANA